MNLIVFFNGWGMDSTIFSDFPIPKNYNVKIVNFPYNVELDYSKYNKIYFVGWSFGCYYLTKFLIDNSEIRRDLVIAINGHGETIGKNGINSKMFNLTLDTLNEENLLKFYENMEITEKFKSPRKSMELIKLELEEFKRNYIPLKNVFNRALLGKRDKIIPFSKMKNYFLTENVEMELLECGHYPFEVLNSWEKIIGEKDEF